MWSELRHGELYKMVYHFPYNPPFMYSSIVAGDQSRNYVTGTWHEGAADAPLFMFSSLDYARDFRNIRLGTASVFRCKYYGRTIVPAHCLDVSVNDWQRNMRTWLGYVKYEGGIGPYQAQAAPVGTVLLWGVMKLDTLM